MDGSVRPVCESREEKTWTRRQQFEKSLSGFWTAAAYYDNHRSQTTDWVLLLMHSPVTNDRSCSAEAYRERIRAAQTSLPLLRRICPGDWVVVGCGCARLLVPLSVITRDTYCLRWILSQRQWLPWQRDVVTLVWWKKGGIRNEANNCGAEQRKMTIVADNCDWISIVDRCTE